MKTHNFPEDRSDKNRRREQLEQDFVYIISVLGSTNQHRTTKRFEAALTNINSSLLSLALYFCRNEQNRSRREELAKQAVQDWHRKMLTTGFRSYLNQGRGRPFSPYAIRSLRNSCYSLRREKRDFGSQEFDEFGSDFEYPDKLAELRELQTDFRMASQFLPPHYRECLLLIYWEGLSLQEVAQKMGTKPQTIANWAHRARNKLRDQFQDRGHWPL